MLEYNGVECYLSTPGLLPKGILCHQKLLTTHALQITKSLTQTQDHPVLSGCITSLIVCNTP